MSFQPGRRLGPYEILAPIGAGGMGEVYRAHGTTLNRDVALKVLLDAVVSDAQRAVAAFWLYVNLTSRPGSASLSAADPIA